MPSLSSLKNRHEKFYKEISISEPMPCEEYYPDFFKKVKTDPVKPIHEWQMKALGYEGYFNKCKVQARANPLIS